MGLFDRLERGLERAVNGAFARAFKAEVQPVEIAAAMRRAMDDRAAILGKNRTIVPNLFTVELAPSDYDRLTAYSDVLTDELIAAAQEHAETQRYSPGGRLQVHFETDEDLETGVFRVRPSTAKTDPYAASAPSQPVRQAASGAAARPTTAGAAGTGTGTGTGTANRAAAGSAPGESSSRRPAHDEDPAGGATGRTGGPLPEDGPDEASYSSAQAPGIPMPQAEPGRPAPVQMPAVPPAATPVPIPSPIVERTPRREPAPQPARPMGNPSERPWLDIDGERYPLLRALTVLGRDDSADIVLDDPGISRRHTELRVTTDGPHFAITIRDLGSTNGTFVNGERITSQRVQEGDRITVGRTSVTLRLGRR